MKLPTFSSQCPDLAGGTFGRAGRVWSHPIPGENDEVMDAFILHHVALRLTHTYTRSHDYFIP